MIRLQTKLGNDIPNAQNHELSALEQNSLPDLRLRHGNAKFRVENSPTYNCHGLTFASRRTRIYSADSVRKIISDDEYQEVAITDILPGDVICYLDESGDVSHSGIVLAAPASAALKVLSKWGSGPEVIHDVDDVPAIYGHIRRFYRCMA